LRWSPATLVVSSPLVALPDGLIGMFDAVPAGAKFSAPIRRTTTNGLPIILPDLKFAPGDTMSSDVPPDTGTPPGSKRGCARGCAVPLAVLVALVAPGAVVGLGIPGSLGVKAICVVLVMLAEWGVIDAVRTWHWSLGGCAGRLAILVALAVPGVVLVAQPSSPGSLGQKAGGVAVLVLIEWGVIKAVRATDWSWGDLAWWD